SDFRQEQEPSCAPPPWRHATRHERRSAHRACIVSRHPRRRASVLKLIWFIPRPVRDIEGAEALYQGQHVRRGMRQENLRAFRISRALFPQPPSIVALNGSDEPASFRFSEGYWDTFEDVQECYRSPNGLAALADGMLNASPRVPTLGSVFFAEE